MDAPAHGFEITSGTICEELQIVDEQIIRRVTAGSFRGETRSEVNIRPHIPNKSTAYLQDTWDQLFLRADRREDLAYDSRPLGIVDLFAGCGGFSLGVSLAAEAVRLNAIPCVAVDTDKVALSVYRRNLGPKSTLDSSVADLVDYRVGVRGKRIDFSYVPEITSEALATWKGRVTAVIGGPPCQGHSNFNNRSRRDDPRNSLYLTLPAAAVALEAPLVVIENVPDVVRDKTDVVGRAVGVLESEGYKVDHRVVSALDLGLPQTRRRHILIASRALQPDLACGLRALSRNQRSVEWAIGDLRRSENPDDPFNLSAELSIENKARIDHLFDEGIYNLPDHVRPDCHKEGHSYPSVYGRLAWGQPAGTVTTGFLSPGRGRFIHPAERRGITPHEAARFQGFPDWFKFTTDEGRNLKNKEYSKLIGEAVPPVIGYLAGLCAFATLSENDLKY